MEAAQKIPHLSIKESFVNSKKISLIERNRFVYIKENVFESTKYSLIQRSFFFDRISKKCFFDSQKLFSGCMTIRFDYGFDLVIINFIWPTWTLLIFKWKIPRTEFIKPISTLSSKASWPYTSRNFLAACAAFFPLQE